jgi:pantothenate kinase
VTDRARPVTDLVARARALAGRPGRAILGLAGPPGAGKSTLAEHLAAALGPGTVATVGMDGFHIGDGELRRMGLRDRKGAPETFDRAGYAALLARLRGASGPVYVPVFDRAIEDSIAAAASVPPGAGLVVTEGNYLLLWPEIRPLLDEIWYLDPPGDERVEALVRRHVAFGRSPQDARAWVAGTDERNAELVARDRDSADLIVGWGEW